MKRQPACCFSTIENNEVLLQGHTTTQDSFPHLYPRFSNILDKSSPGLCKGNATCVFMNWILVFRLKPKDHFTQWLHDWNHWYINCFFLRKLLLSNPSWYNEVQTKLSLQRPSCFILFLPPDGTEGQIQLQHLASKPLPIGSHVLYPFSLKVLSLPSHWSHWNSKA